jgi:hypothetical protein
LPCRSLRRAIGAAIVTAALALSAMPAPSFALDPARPLPGYRPTFVTEREPGVWQDCSWAVAAMLLDKWTNGATVIDRQRLRALSGDAAGGSNLADIKKAFARLGLSLGWSPSGGDVVTWPKLLDRLGRGSGAILMGDYANLPRRYGRWDLTFWTNTGTQDDHALYLDAYDATSKKILVMDPLAPAGWGGEWIPVSILKKFAWHSGSALWTATTPTAAADLFDGVTLATATASGHAGTLEIRWPAGGAPASWVAPGITATLTAEPLAAPDPLAVDVLVNPGAPAASPTSPVDVGGPFLTATAAIPTAPGIYRATVTASEHRFNRQVATAGPFNLYVAGPRNATIVTPAERRITTGALARISLLVTNTGSESWAEIPAEPGLARFEPRRNTRLVGTWVGPPFIDRERARTDMPETVDLGPLPLAAGEAQTVESVATMPSDPGTWRLVVQLVDDLAGPDAFLGSVPASLAFDVRAPGDGGPLE